jgi:hypothetical protein
MSLEGRSCIKHSEFLGSPSKDDIYSWPNLVAQQPKPRVRQMPMRGRWSELRIEDPKVKPSPWIEDPGQAASSDADRATIGTWAFP